MFREYIHRLFWLILGVAVSSIGIAMMLQANVGLERGACCSKACRCEPA